MMPMTLWQRTKPTSSVPTASPKEEEVEEQDDAQYYSTTSRLGKILSSWTNPTITPSSLDTGIATVDTLKSSSFLQLKPGSISRQQLLTARPLYQVSTKFIPIVLQGGLLAIVDQHAADERCRLEALKAEIMTARGLPKEKFIHGTNTRMVLVKPQLLDLAPSELVLFDTYSNIACSWGWRWTTVGPNSISVTQVPIISGSNALTATDLRLYLHQLYESHGQAVVPNAVIRALNSKACRSAVMFGDELVPAECEGLIERLKKTELCFICAHGRPTTAPLVDLKALKRAVSMKQQQQNRTINSDRIVNLKAKLLNDLGSVL